MRLFVPSLAGGMEQALQVREQLLGTGVVHRVELEPRTGSMLVCYDERKVEAAVIEGAVTTEEAAVSLDRLCSIRSYHIDP